MWEFTLSKFLLWISCGGKLRNTRNSRSKVRFQNLNPNCDHTDLTSHPHYPKTHQHSSLSHRSRQANVFTCAAFHANKQSSLLCSDKSAFRSIIICFPSAGESGTSKSALVRPTAVDPVLVQPEIDVEVRKKKINSMEFFLKGQNAPSFLPRSAKDSFVRLNDLRLHAVVDLLHFNR